jgi:hypothetical protein
MTEPANIESRGALLQRLFDLMEKCDGIRVLAPDRKERIKGKYRQASVENIQSGILMLEADIEKKKVEQEKAKQSLIKNIDRRKELRELEKIEISESENLAEQLLTRLGKTNKSKMKWWVIPVLVLLLAVCLYYFGIIRF